MRLRAVFRWWTIALLTVALLVLAPVYWIALHSPAVGMFHDDGVYLVTAKALATGQGYRIISLPDAIPQTKYPILFPWVLSLVWRLTPQFPANTFVLKLVPMAFAVIWFWLTFRLIARESSRAVAAICTAITASMLWAIYLGSALLSETLFAALCTAFLILLRGVELGNSSRKHWIAAAVLAGLACLTRTAGVCAIATGFICFLTKRQFGRAAGFLAIAIAVCGPWFLWVSAQNSPPTDAYYSAANYGSWNVLSHYFPMDRKITIIVLNALALLRTPLSPIILNGWLQLCAGVIMLIAGGVLIRERTVLDIFLGIYVAMTLAWAWPPDRFMVIVYPLILLSGWRIWQALQMRMKQSAPAVNLVGMACVSVAMGFMLWRAGAAAQATQRTGVVLGQQGQPDPWSDTLQQVNWIREQTPPDAILLANIDPLFYLYTGRKGVRGYMANPYELFYNAVDAGREPLGTVADLREAIRRERVTYIVRAANGTFAEATFLDKLILELVRSESGAFRLVAQGADPRFQIYHVERPL